MAARFWMVVSWGRSGESITCAAVGENGNSVAIFCIVRYN